MRLDLRLTPKLVAIESQLNCCRQLSAAEVLRRRLDPCQTWYEEYHGHRLYRRVALDGCFPQNLR